MVENISKLETDNIECPIEPYKTYNLEYEQNIMYRRLPNI
jgi:hypothetical protein